MCKNRGEIVSNSKSLSGSTSTSTKVCPDKIWSVLHMYHNYINPNRENHSKIGEGDGDAGVDNNGDMALALKIMNTSWSG